MVNSQIIEDCYSASVGFEPIATCLIDKCLDNYVTDAGIVPVIGKNVPGIRYFITPWANEMKHSLTVKMTKY